MRKLQLIILIVTCLFISNCSYGQKSSNEKATGKSNTQNSSKNIREILNKQVLLTNYARFTNERELQGASGFLIKYSNANFAVTARHLLGEAGGIEPEIQIDDLNKAIIQWEMKPRVVVNSAKETIKVDAQNLNFSQSKTDIVLLKVNSNDFEIHTLSPNFNLPEIGETLYLLGCPYSQPKCNQNFYEVKYIEFEESQKLLLGEINTKDNLSGFSGAPLVNSKGEVVGVLVGGGESEGRNYITATHIKEIQKVKF